MGVGVRVTLQIALQFLSLPVDYWAPPSGLPSCSSCFVSPWSGSRFGPGLFFWLLMGPSCCLPEQWRCGGPVLFHRLLDSRTLVDPIHTMLPLGFHTPQIHMVKAWFTPCPEVWVGASTTYHRFFWGPQTFCPLTFCLLGCERLTPLTSPGPLVVTVLESALGSLRTSLRILRQNTVCNQSRSGLLHLEVLSSFKGAVSVGIHVFLRHILFKLACLFVYPCGLPMLISCQVCPVYAVS